MAKIFLCVGDTPPAEILNLIQKHPECKKGAAKNLKKARMKKN